MSPGYRGTGGIAVTSFADTLGVADNATNLGTPNRLAWVQVPVNWDTPFNNPPAFPNFAFASLLSGGGGFGLKVTANQMAINPLYAIAMGIIPQVLLGTQGPYYRSAQKFVQWTFNAIVAGVAGGIGFVNFECNSGTGVAGNNNAMANDGYIFRIDLGTLERHNSGAAPTTLHAGIAQAQFDVFRLSMDATIPGQNTLTVTKNGVVQYSVVDNAATRVINGVAFPVIYFVATTGTGAEMKNFSTGIGL